MFTLLEGDFFTDLSDQITVDDENSLGYWTNWVGVFQLYGTEYLVSFIIIIEFIIIIMNV